MGIINQTLNMERRDANITINTNTPTVKGQLKLNIMINDNDKLVNGGFIIFKINGKTQYNKQGQQIRINVVKGIATLNYTLPDNMGVGKYNITIVYNNRYYNTQRKTENFTITKISLTNTIIPEITTTMGENTTIKLQINDTNGKQITGNTKICIKINGKTYTNTKITNGKIQLTLKTDTLKNPKYQITIIIGENSYYYPARYIITLKINKTERQTKETNTKT